MSDDTASADDPDAEGADETGEDGAAPKKKLNKFVLIGAAAALVLTLGGGAAFFFLFMGGPPSGEAMAAAKPSIFYDLPEMTVNLSAEEGQKEQFLKLNISLEVADQSVIDLIEPNMPRVLDAFQVYLRELRKSDLEGSAGLYLLKEELRRRVNIAVQPAEVDGILFKEILVQ